MTGTADTEAYEFQQIYGLDTVVLPTNRPMIRDDMGDLVYLTEQENTQRSLKISRSVLRNSVSAGGYYIHRTFGTVIEHPDERRDES